MLSASLAPMLLTAGLVIVIITLALILRRISGRIDRYLEHELSHTAPTSIQEVEQLTDGMRRAGGSIETQDVPPLLGGIVCILAGAILYYGSVNQKSTFQQQIDKIDSIKTTLADLQTYLNNQQASLTDAQNYLNSLQEQNRQLEPVLTANQDQINAILQQYSKQERGRAWINYFISFLTGIATSLIASVIFRRFFPRRTLIAPQEVEAGQEHSPTGTLPVASPSNGTESASTKYANKKE